MKIPHYDERADCMTKQATAIEKGRFEKSRNTYGWTQFYRSLYPQMSVPYMRWDGEVIDLADYTDTKNENKDEEDWVTIKGTHVLLNEEGVAQSGGKLAGMSFTKAKSIRKAKPYQRPAAQDKTIRQIISKTANLRKEQLRIVDTDGNIVLEKRGEHGSVYAKVGEKRQHMEGNISIHNHPEGGTFSPEDLDDFGFGAREMVIACPEGTYSLVNDKYGTKEQARGWHDMRDALEAEMPRDVSAFALLQQARENLENCHEMREMHKIQNKWMEMKNSGATNDELNAYTKESGYNDYNESYKAKVKEEARRLETEPFHEFYKKNAAKFGFTYTFTPRKKRKRKNSDSLKGVDDKDSLSIEDRINRIRQSIKERADEEDWITVKGTHVLLNEQGVAQSGGKLTGKTFSSAKSVKTGAGSKGPALLRSGPPSADSLTDALKPAQTGYDVTLEDSFDDFVKKNIGNKRNPKMLYGFYHKIEDEGGDGYEACKEEYNKTRLALCSKDFKEVSRDEADETLADNLYSGTVHQWFTEYNHEVKEALVAQMTKSPEVHNAALNIMYGNYKYFCKEQGTEPLPYDEFLVTPIKMYRGGTGKEYDGVSPFSSYTFSRKVAESFTGSDVGQGAKLDPNGVVYEAEIRPIDTYGSVFTNGESEILVPGMIAPNKNRDSAEEGPSGTLRIEDKVARIRDALLKRKG